MPPSIPSIEAMLTCQLTRRVEDLVRSLEVDGAGLDVQNFGVHAGNVEAEGEVSGDPLGLTDFDPAPIAERKIHLVAIAEGHFHAEHGLHLDLPQELRLLKFLKQVAPQGLQLPGVVIGLE